MDPFSLLMMGLGGIANTVGNIYSANEQKKLAKQLMSAYSGERNRLSGAIPTGDELFNTQQTTNDVTDMFARQQNQMANMMPENEYGQRESMPFESLGNVLNQALSGLRQQRAGYDLNRESTIGNLASNYVGTLQGIQTPATGATGNAIGMAGNQMSGYGQYFGLQNLLGGGGGGTGNGDISQLIQMLLNNNSNQYGLGSQAWGSWINNNSNQIQ